MTKAKASKNAGRKCNLKVMLTTLLEMQENEGMNVHTPKWSPTLRVGVPMESHFFRKPFQGSNFIELKSFVYHWKALETKIFKMGSHDPFEYI
jgi:hypothetical protein